MISIQMRALTLLIVIFYIVIGTSATNELRKNECRCCDVNSRLIIAPGECNEFGFLEPIPSEYNSNLNCPEFDSAYQFSNQLMIEDSGESCNPEAGDCAPGLECIQVSTNQFQCLPALGAPTADGCTNNFWCCRNRNTYLTSCTPCRDTFGFCLTSQSSVCGSRQLDTWSDCRLIRYYNFINNVAGRCIEGDRCCKTRGASTSSGFCLACNNFLIDQMCQIPSDTWCAEYGRVYGFDLVGC